MKGYVLDAGPLGAIDEHDASAKRVMRLLQRALELNLQVVVPAPALAQAFHDGRRQALLARLIRRTYVTLASLDGATATQLGPLRKRSKHPDVVDVHVAWLAQTNGLHVVTTDPDDMKKLGVDDESVIEI